MLNRIIHLQAVLEVITNQTALATELLTSQQQQMRSMMYQNHLALDYLLAAEGEVCGKFNFSERCIEIDDHGDVIRNITKNIRKLAHVPVQGWTPLLKGGWWEDWFNGNWWKNVGFILLCSVAGLLFLPCIIPCFIRLITSTVQGMQLITMPQNPKDPAGPPQKIMICRTKRDNKSETTSPETVKEIYEKYQVLREIYGGKY